MLKKAKRGSLQKAADFRMDGGGTGTYWQWRRLHLNPLDAEASFLKISPTENHPMKRFFDRINEKALDPRQAPVLMIALGDSLSQGVMEHRVLDSSAVFHRHVQTMLEDFYPCTTFSTINAGVSGDNVRGGGERLERDVLCHQPDLVVIGYGSNDSLKGCEGIPEFDSGLREIIRRIRERTKADLLLLTPPLMATTTSARIHPEHQICVEEIIGAQTNGSLSVFAERIREISRDEKVPLADVNREWIRLREAGFDTDVWMVNGLNHPNPTGHRLAALTIFHTLLCQRPMTKFCQ